MKLVVSELDALSRYVSREFFHVMRGLLDAHGWSHVETDELRRDARPLRAALLERFGTLPEVVLFWEGYDLVNARAAELQQINCRKLVFADDLHSWDAPAKQSKRVAFLVCDTVLAAYAYAFAEFFPDIAAARRVVWIPHAASPDFLLPFDSQAENAVLLSGAINHHYPLRERAKALHDARGFPTKLLPHPGYACDFDHERDPRVGCGYARELNRHRAAFAASPRYGYLVAKYFEIPAAGALLLADDSMRAPLAQLGFAPGVHYLPVSAEDLERQLSYVSDAANHARLDHIRRAAQQHVHANHTTADRARLVNEVCSR